MDFFNSEEGEGRRWVPVPRKRSVSLRSLALENVESPARLPDVPLPSADDEDPDYHTSITVRISRLERWTEAGGTGGVEVRSRSPVEFHASSR